MRYVAAAMACLLVACSGLPPSTGSSCTTAYECEIEAYAKAR
jgi:hypothetical protein